MHRPILLEQARDTRHKRAFRSETAVHIYVRDAIESRGGAVMLDLACLSFCDVR